MNTQDDLDGGACDASHCSLREAIHAANALPGTDTIAFSIPGSGVPTIRPTSELPEVTDPVIIDGTTEPAGKVELDGTLSVPAPDHQCTTLPGTCGLVISAGNSTVRGLVINRFGSTLLYLKGAGQNTIVGNFVGTDVSGTISFNWKTVNGILVESDGNTIGGLRQDTLEPCVRECNLISGNVNGVLIGGYNLNSSGNIVQGNFIGTDVSGIASLENSLGVEIFGSNNTIGGLASGTGNVISGNYSGVLVTSYGTNATANVVQGNLIGTDVTGLAPLGNHFRGAWISASAGNLIGGTAPGAGNTIAFNGQEGVLIASGFVDSVNNAVLSNSIFANGRLGLELFEIVYGDGVSLNDAGDDDAGPNNLQNFPLLTGVTREAQSTSVRGTLNSRPNTSYRLEFFDNSEIGPSGYGEGEKFIGSINVTTNSTGRAGFTATFATLVAPDHFVSATATDPQNNTSEFSPGLPPDADQATLTVNSSDDSTDGRCSPIHCSLRDAIIAANAFPGPHRIVFDIPGAGVPSVRLSHELPTIRNPVIIDGSTQLAGTVELDGSNAIGSLFGANGLSIEAGNSTVQGLVINRFRGNGILLFGRRGNTIQGNYIGTDITGTQGLGNGNGITVASDSNTIGGSTAAARNIISGNMFSGVDIYCAYSLTAGSRVQGNYIGTDVTGRFAIGNNTGVHLQCTTMNTIGGSNPGEGNVIAGNQYAGVHFDGGADQNLVQGNRIGSNATGTAALGRTYFGVHFNRASYNTIGGTVAAARNLILAQERAVDFADNPGVGNTLLDNQFELPVPSFVVNLTGDTDDDNLSDGRCDMDTDAAGDQCTLRAAIQQANATPGTNAIEFAIPGDGVPTIRPQSELPEITDPVSIDGTSQIGYLGRPLIELNGSAAGANVDGLTITAGQSVVRGLAINRFTGSGIVLRSVGGNRIESNFIGTDASGTTALGNHTDGVLIDESRVNTIGGTTRGLGNVISSNGTLEPITRGAGIQITGPGATGNHVQNNLIGTDVTGTLDLGNIVGVFISDAPANFIGGTADVTGNVISGNNLGLAIIGSAAAGNRVQGNFIGTDVTGRLVLGNGCGCGGGVFIQGAPRNTIGGTAAGEGNVISANNGLGLVLQLPQATENVVQGNLIGTDVSGSLALGNFFDGVSIQDARGNTIGGTSAGAGNVISANGFNGVVIASTGASGNSVVGNFIGTDKTGTIALGNHENGVLLGGPENTVGGTTLAARNVISGNMGNGVHILYDSATGRANFIHGNLIGTDVTGTADLGNGAAGVLIDGGYDNMIGGTAAGAANTIAFNGRGVVVTEVCRNQPGCDGALGNAILSNSILLNDGLGIDLGDDGPTLNDPADDDIGPNDLPNFPVLIDASGNARNTEIRGTIHSSPNTTFLIEFFSNRTADSSGYGEGESLMGSTKVTTDSSGAGDFRVSLPTGVRAGQSITATATDRNGNTSEFSAAIQVTQSPGPSSAGAVRVKLVGGRLVIQGSSAADNVRIEAAGPNAFRLSPGAGTLINGQAEPVVFSGVTRVVQVRLGDANDSILLDGSVNPLTIGGGLSIDAGSGDDTIRLDGVAIRGRTNLDAGTGNDLVAITDSILSRELNLISGSGADRIVLEHSHFIRQVLIEAARRQDLLDLDDSVFDLRPLITENVARFPR